MTTTLRDRYALGLSAFGYQREETASKKYWLYVKRGASPTYFWLGKAGAVRYSSIRRIDTSVAATDKTRATILKKGEQQ
jgi:hypothetical protein